MKFLEMTEPQPTGDKGENFTDAVQEVLKFTSEVPNEIGMSIEDQFPTNEGAAESMSVSGTPSYKTTSAKSKGKKRKQVDDGDNAIVAAINKFADITKDTMTDLIKQLATEASNEKISNAHDEVLNAMGTMHELTDDEKVVAAELLVDNHNKLSLLLRLGQNERLSLARRLLRGS